MACTLQELQKCEYEILCKFADFCLTHGIEYGLFGGTLLGAVRHNDIIPWDDDIDVYMSAKAFKKFMRCIRKTPIPGLHFSWINTDPDYPFYFAKLRKCGTFMPEQMTKTFDMHNGVWIDIFVYVGVPTNQRLAALQKKLYYLFATVSRIGIYNQIDAKNAQNETVYNSKYRFVQGLSRKNQCRLRKLLFALYTGLDRQNSKEIMFNNWSLQLQSYWPRTFVQPLQKHILRDRDFLIPQHYHDYMTVQYGDYMTPKEFPSHTDLSKIQL